MSPQRARSVGRFKWQCLLGVLLAICAAFAAPGQNAAYSEDAVKAAFLYRFAGYIEWPPEALTAPQFTIAVLGSDAVAAELGRLLPQRSIKNRPAQVRAIKNLAALDDARMLYIGKNYRGNVSAVVAAVGARPVLIVTDDVAGLDQGAAVNFVPMDRRVRFEVSLAAATRAGLKIGADLLSVAARVRGAPLRSDAGCQETNTGIDAACLQRVAAL